jgi:glycosyltransferase involved in cell wall biosynthesis
MGSFIGFKVTPLVLTFNEELNIGRTLRSLRWANRVIVLDSGSTDATESVARSFSNVDWRIRPFDSFKNQCEYGIRATGIETDYVLALDADMVLTEELVAEIEEQFIPRHYAGGYISFLYCILGHPLAGSLYPAQMRLFLRGQAEVLQDGHGHKFKVEGPIYNFKAPLIHDDRKPVDRWVSSQLTYSAIEAERIATGKPSKWQDRLRQLGLMPPVAAALAYLRAGGPLRGAASARYAYERATYECLLAMRLMSARLKNNRDQHK